jgi:poly(A) polymerase
MFLFAVLLWPVIRRLYERATPEAGMEIDALVTACEQATARQQGRIAVPKRFTLPMREMIALQPRFDRRDGRRALRMLDHPRFRAAYDFLLLRAAAGEVPQELADWWTQIQAASAEERLKMVERDGASAPARPRRRRRRRRTSQP